MADKNKSDEMLYAGLSEITRISWELVKRTMTNIYNIRQSLNSKKEKFTLLGFKLVNLLLIFKYNLNPTIILVPEYFIFKSTLEIISEYIVSKKYIWISKIYNNKIKVIKVENGIYTLYSFITVTEIQKKQDKLEHGLNRVIDSIKRGSKNLRLITITTSPHLDQIKKVKLKPVYPLSQVIKDLDVKMLKGKKIPYLRGINEKGDPVVGDLYKDKNILIAAVPGGGKSVLDGCFIQTLMLFNDMEFVLIDFKIVELCLYENFDNVAFVENTEGLKETLKKLTAEMEKRYQLMRGKYTHIDQYNAHSKYKQSYIVVVIDEVSEIRLNGNGDTKEIENDLLVLMNKGRAAGIYFICCTQNPKSDQINPSIKNNCQLRFVGKIPDIPTQVLIGVRGTENFETGYFKTNEGEVYYSAFVDPKKENTTFNEIKAIREKEKKNYVNLNKIL